ncbi:MAG TPA: NYN domain-containing protein [Longimicrobiales bacterium]
MKRVAVLLDGGFVLRKLYPLVGRRMPTADEVCDFAHRCIHNADEALFRIYFYHCRPCEGTETHPLTRAAIDFAQSRTAAAMGAFLREIALKDHVAFRAGELSFDGWEIARKAAKDLIATGRAVAPADVVPDLKQKRVDMKIGLDVAWLASKRIVDRILLVTGDSDFVPAMKFARREGVQVALVTLGHRQVKHDLVVHADELRAVQYP